MLKEIPEIQDFLMDAFEKSRHHGDLQDLYRRRYGVSDFFKLEQSLTVTF
jgi:hypothetical protein